MRETTLLILTWDEHGGFYDHRSPPAAAPPDHKNQEGFGFDRLGVRARPCSFRNGSSHILSSSLPKATSTTSILRFLSDKWDLGPLGNRTAEAASFAGTLTSSPNDAAPKKVGKAPRPADLSIVSDASPPALNKNQAALIEFTRQLGLEMQATPSGAGTRAIRAASGVEGEVEVAKNECAYSWSSRFSSSFELSPCGSS